MRKKFRRRKPNIKPPKYEKNLHRTMREKFASVLELPPIVPGVPSRIELHSNRELIIEGCKEILEYDENLIRINLGKINIQIMGNYLALRGITDDSVVIEGIIQSLDFQENIK